MQLIKIKFTPYGTYNLRALMNRRDFINIGTTTGSLLLLDNLQAMATPLSKTTPPPGFELLIFATNWGYVGSWEQFCSQIKNDGYDGAEIWFPNEREQTEVMATFKKHGLQYGFLIGSGDSRYQSNFQQFKKSLEGAVTFNPVYINCHSGKDFFSFDENKTFIELTTKASKESGIPIYHETHRSRILYSAPTARQYMEKLPDLRITFDVSHWCNVHESLLADQAETISMALERVGHIHARIGHPEGPQVNDPRAPEWKNAVDAHFAWWDQVVKKKKQEGKRITFLTEFGPVDYLPSLPYTRQPLANQWEINIHMLKTLRSRYA
jgi:sugar phosphate isomerase/epimerase